MTPYQVQILVNSKLHKELQEGRDRAELTRLRQAQQNNLATFG